jgi:hypothetical protein
VVGGVVLLPPAPAESDAEENKGALSVDDRGVAGEVALSEAEAVEGEVGDDRRVDEPERRLDGLALIRVAHGGGHVPERRDVCHLVEQDPVPGRRGGGGVDGLTRGEKGLKESHGMDLEIKLLFF